MFIQACHNPVTFASAKQDLALPSPKYLAVHAACAKITHMSGAAEFIDKALRDMESINVLANDGGSACLLEAALMVLAVR